MSPPPLFLPFLLRLFPFPLALFSLSKLLSCPALCCQAAVWSSAKLNTGRQPATRPTQTHTHTEEHTYTSVHTCPYTGLTHMLVSGHVPPHTNSQQWQRHKIPTNSAEKQTESLNEPLINFFWPYLPPGESQTNHAAKTASCTRHWSNISFRLSAPHGTSVCVRIRERCAVCVSSETGGGKWGEILLCMYLCRHVCFTFLDNGWLWGSPPSFKGSFLDHIRLWARAALSLFSPQGLLWDHCTNLTLLAVATDDKVDADALRANTGLWKYFFSVSVLN